MNNSADYGRTTTTAIGFRSVFEPEKWRKTALGGPFGVPWRVPEACCPALEKCYKIYYANKMRPDDASAYFLGILPIF